MVKGKPFYTASGFKTLHQDKCARFECTRAKDPDSRYCNDDRCRNRACPNSYDCRTHKCARKYCRQSPAWPSEYCPIHKCTSTGCMQDSQNCTQHTCTALYCTKPKVKGGSHFCRIHACPVTGCMNRVPCTPHVCQVDYCDATRMKGFRWCNGHKCHDPQCPDLASECLDHICRACAFPVQAGESYCQAHRCPYATGCKYGRSNCPDHVCEDTYCHTRKLEGSPYCERHKCVNTHCPLPRKCPVHVCQSKYCLTPKTDLDDSFCIYHKCLKCPSLRVKCEEHRCTRCKQNPMVNVMSELCLGCSCTFGACLEPRAFKTVCTFHAPRCMDCTDIATFYSHDVKKYLFCARHKCCQICTHKPRNACKTICDNHRKRESMYPWMYPTADKTKLRLRSMDDYTVLAKAYYQSCERSAIIPGRVLGTSIATPGGKESLLSHTLEYVLGMPTELFVELMAHLFCSTKDD